MLNKDKKNLTYYLFTTMIAILFVCSFSISHTSWAEEKSQKEEKLGLLIIAHGSRSPKWNAPVLKIEEEVKNILSEKGKNPFDAIRVALMEFSEPSISAVVKEMENNGIDRVYALPLFIAPSGHSLFDVPTILGLYSEKEIVNDIKEEGLEIVDTDMNITVGPTLHKGHVIREIMLDRVKELSEDPDSEGLVILAHGSHTFEPIWRGICQKVGSYVCAKTGIENFDYALVEVGQSFIPDGVPVILNMAEKYDKTIVVGVYVSMGVERMAHNSSIRVGGMMEMESKEIFADKNIHFAKQGLLPDKRIAEWIADRSIEWSEEKK